ncbi:MAG: hypothetical protein HIU92_20410 [Proteobacteria bacterium]|nr:hypothetical protein [Pseudomonadota bacterium]
MFKILAISLLMLSPSVAMAQEYQPHPYDPNATSDSANGDNGDQGVGTNGDATNSYGVPNTTDQDLCCGMTSSQPGGGSTDGSGSGSTDTSNGG